MITFLVAYVAVIINAVGSIYSIAEVVGKGGIEGRVTRGIGFTGLGGFAAGLLGVIGTVSFGFSPGVVLVTRVGSRFAVTVCRAFLFPPGLFPKIFSRSGGDSRFSRRRCYDHRFGGPDRSRDFGLYSIWTGAGGVRLLSHWDPYSHGGNRLHHAGRFFPGLSLLSPRLVEKWSRGGYLSGPFAGTPLTSTEEMNLEALRTPHFET